MTEREPDTTLSYRRSLDQNRELRDENARLIEFLERPRPAADAPEALEWASSLSAQLVSLHRQISQHFRDEDGAGVLERLAERYPRASRKLDALRAEHDTLSSELQQIVAASMAYAEAKVPDDPRLRERTRSLLDSIARHESEETALIQELVFTDVGGSE